jgi:hypothetical protein
MASLTLPDPIADPFSCELIDGVYIDFRFFFRLERGLIANMEISA